MDVLPIFEPPSSMKSRRRARNLVRVCALASGLAAAGASLAATPIAAAPVLTVKVDGPIAFASFRDGNYEIYRMKADGGSPVRLTNNAAIDLQPSWSPNGAKIAFVSNRDDDSHYEIYTMNADGSGQTRITNNATDDASPSWSPDGKKIVFSRGSGISPSSDPPAEIYTMNANGTGLTRLTNDTDVDGSPSWSPDGKKIVYVHGLEEAEIYTMNANGSAQTQITNNRVSDAAPAWSPKGDKIAFARRLGPQYDIFSMNPDGTGQTNLTNYAPTPGSPYDNGDDFAPAWSPNGAKIAFESNRDSTDEDNSQIYTMNANGSAQTNRTGTPASTNEDPAWGVSHLRVGIHLLTSSAGPAPR